MKGRLEQLGNEKGWDGRGEREEKGGHGNREANIWEVGEGRDHQVLLPIVEELSEWRSPPPQRPSTRTQTGPAGRQRKRGSTEKHTNEQTAGKAQVWFQRCQRALRRDDEPGVPAKTTTWKDQRWLVNKVLQNPTFVPNALIVSVRFTAEAL